MNVTGRRPTQGISYRSTKREIWAEKEQQDETLREQGVRIRVLEEETGRLEKEIERLKRENEFVLRLKTELGALNEKYDLLNQMTRELTALDSDRIFDVCVTKVPYLLGARYASVYLYDDKREKLILKKHSHPRHLDHVIDAKENPDSLMVQVIKEGEVRVIGDIVKFEDQRGVRISRRFADYYMTSSCVIAPLKHNDRVLGVVNLADRLDGKAFSMKEDLPLIVKVSELLAVAIRNVQLFEQVERQARTDPLTGLMNHQGFFDEVQREADRATRYGVDLAVLFLDIDRFKALNENQGHLVGDQVLEEIGRLIREELRPSEIAARYGADEFAILLPAQDKQGALKTAERLRDRIAKHPFACRGATLHVQVSAGIADLTSGPTPSEIARAADRALEQAKASGTGIAVA